MALLGFKARFAEAVETGVKCQTIRAFRRDGRNPRPGEKLYLYTALRTKSCRKLGETVCTSVEQITIDMNGINVAGKWLATKERGDMANADGFPDWISMRAFFISTHQIDDQTPFSGLLVKWRPS